MENNWPLALLIPLVVGVILLVLEYRTKWFANRLDRRPKRKETKAINWMDAVQKAKTNLNSIYVIYGDDVYIRSWEVNKEGTMVKIELSMNIFIDPKSITRGSYLVWADAAGNILHAVDYQTGIREMKERNSRWK